MSTGSASVRERLVGRYGWIADQLRFLAGDRLALGGVIVIALFGFLGLFGPLLAPHDPVAYSARTASGSIAVLEAPNLDSWFGTTAFGKDVFSQFLAGHGRRSSSDWSAASAPASSASSSD